VCEAVRTRVCVPVHPDHPQIRSTTACVASAPTPHYRRIGATHLLSRPYSGGSGTDVTPEDYMQQVADVMRAKMKAAVERLGCVVSCLSFRRAIDDSLRPAGDGTGVVGVDVAPAESPA
jgi:hypothetical protein